MRCLNAHIVKANPTIRCFVEKGQSLSMVNITNDDEQISVNITNGDEQINVNINAFNLHPRMVVTLSTTSLNVNISTLCKVGVIDKDRELFLVKEGILLLVDGKQLKVLKYELSE
jgi:hypothetical protein